MEENVVLDSSISFDDSRPEIEVIDSGRFLLLFVLTLGLYGLWWMYKSWRFFKEKESLDIMPAMRAIFAIFFAYSLFEKIREFSRQNGYQKDYSSGMLVTGFIVLNILSRLPDPYWLVSILGGLCFIQPVNALMFAIESSQQYNVKGDGFNTRQIILIIVGLILWALMLIGLFAPAADY
jgi:hypothetical protein